MLVVEIAKNQNDLYGGTEDYLVTREFAAKADPDQRRRTVEACSMIVASDEITAEEYAELTQIATKLAPHRPHQAARTPRRQTRLPSRRLTEHGYVIEIPIQSTKELVARAAASPRSWVAGHDPSARSTDGSLAQRDPLSRELERRRDGFGWGLRRVSRRFYRRPRATTPAA